MAENEKLFTINYLFNKPNRATDTLDTQLYIKSLRWTNSDICKQIESRKIKALGMREKAKYDSFQFETRTEFHASFSSICSLKPT